MKAVFMASHSQKNTFLSRYEEINKYLEKRGFDVFTGRLFDRSNNTLEDEDERVKWYKDSVAEIKNADVVVIEISHPSSANIGHILTYAIDIGKPVVALYLRGRDPIFLRGWKEDKFILAEYHDDIEKVLEDSIEYALDKQDTRFNFFISSKHQNFLDWVSKRKRLPRAVYLRKLIEEDMKRNKEFEG
jgi:hypothetical protein